MRRTGLVKKPSKPVLVIIIAGQVASCALACRDVAQRSNDQARGRKKPLAGVRPQPRELGRVAGRR